MEKIFQLSVFIILTLAIFISPAFANYEIPSSNATLTVCESGCNYSTIQAAIDASISGNTILVKPGTYIENVDVSSWVELYIVAESTEGLGNVIIRAKNTSEPTIFVHGPRVTIKGFTLTGSTENASIFLGVEASQANITENVFRSNKYAIQISPYSYNAHISRNIFMNSSQYDIFRPIGQCWLDGTTCNEINCWSTNVSCKSAGNEIYLNDFYSAVPFGGYNDYDSYGSDYYTNYEQNHARYGDNNYWNSKSDNLQSYSYGGDKFSGYLGNYWPTYSGIDSNHDGVGDSTYPVAIEIDNYPLMSPFENYVEYHASCTDTLKNGNETDVDCGGACSPCIGGKTCREGRDCLSHSCRQNKCDPEMIPRGYTDETLEYPSQVVVSGNYAYVADWMNIRIASFDISNPDSIIFKNYTDKNIYYPNDIFVSGNYAYVASSIYNRLAIFDISNPSSIVAKDYTEENLNEPQKVFVSGSYAYVADGNNRLAIFDISNPDSIVAKGYTEENLDDISNIFVSGNYAYVTSYNNRLAIFDISNPSSIVAKGYTNENLNGPDNIFVSGNYAYVTSYNNRLAIFDISNPDSIVAEGYTDENLDSPTDTFISGNYAYVTNYNKNRLAVFDISNPDSIIATGYTNENLNGPTSVFISGKYAYVTSGDNKRLVIFDISGFACPNGICHNETPPSCSIELHKNGFKVSSVNTSEVFDIKVTHYTGDISEVRFLSDELQNGQVDEGFTWTASIDWDQEGVYPSWRPSEKSIEWAFGTHGQKEVWAEIKDSNGQTSTCAARIIANDIVPANQPPVASFVLSSQSPKAGQEIKLDASGSYDLDGKILSYEWDLDGNGIYDGATMSPEIYYYWNSKGAYSVKLRVTDNRNKTSTSVKTIQVQDNSLWDKTKNLFAPSMPTLNENEKKRFQKITEELHIHNTPHSNDPLSDPDFYWVTDDQLLTVLHSKIDSTENDLTYEAEIYNQLNDLTLADLSARGSFSSSPEAEMYFNDMADVNVWADTAGVMSGEFLSGLIEAGGGDGLGIGTILMLPDISKAGMALHFLDDILYKKALWHYFQLRESYSPDDSFELAIEASQAASYNTPEMKEYFEKLWSEYGADHISAGGLNPEFKQAVITQLRNILLSGIEKHRFEPYHVYSIKSPGELRIYDSQGRITGLVNGSVQEEIPNSIYDNESKSIFVFSVNDTYSCKIFGTGTGEYGLEITSIENGTAENFNATNISMTPNEIHEYSIDWKKLSNGTGGVTIHIDSNGDGTPEQTLVSGPDFHIDKTQLYYEGSTSGRYSDNSSLSARLILENGSALSGKIISFSIGNHTINATTNENGTALVDLSLDLAPGDYQLNVSFSGDGTLLYSSNSTEFDVRKELTNISISPIQGNLGEETSVSARIADDEGTPITGGIITFKTSTGNYLGQATSDNTGTAAIKWNLTIPQGSEGLIVAAIFNVTSYYESSSQNTSFIIKIGARSLKANALSKITQLNVTNGTIIQERALIIDAINSSLNASLWKDSTHLYPDNQSTVFVEEYEAVQITFNRARNYEQLIPYYSRLVNSSSCGGNAYASLIPIIESMEAALPVYKNISSDLAKADDILANVSLTEARECSRNISDRAKSSASKQYLTLSQSYYNNALAAANTRPDLAILYLKQSWDYSQSAMRYC